MLYEIKLELREIKERTQSLADKLDNMKLVQEENTTRIDNLEYKLEMEEMGPGQTDGQVESFGNFAPDNNHDFTDHYALRPFNHGQQVYEYNMNPSYTALDEANSPSAEVQMQELRERNEGLENKLNEVMEMLNQIRQQGSDTAQ